MYVALTFVGLSHKQVCDMSSNRVLITDSVTSKYFLQAEIRSVMAEERERDVGLYAYVRALIKALSQFCRLIMDIISGAAFPSSFKRPT